jgi:hypothetical protein
LCGELILGGKLVEHQEDATEGQTAEFVAIQ